MKRAEVLAMLILTCTTACEEEVKETPRVKPKPPVVVSPAAAPSPAPGVNPNPVAGQPTTNCNPAVTPDLCNALLDPRIKAKVDACKQAAQGAASTAIPSNGINPQTGQANPPVINPQTGQPYPPGINPQTGQPYPPGINPQTGQPYAQTGVQPNPNALAACESSEYIARVRAEVALATGTLPNTSAPGGAVQNPANPNPTNPANPNPLVPASSANGPQCAQAYTTGKEIRIRSTKSASSSANILFDDIQPGRIILVLTPAADWTQVEFEGKKGFITSQNTSCLEPADSAFANLDRPKCYINPAAVFKDCRFNTVTQVIFNAWTEIKIVSFNHVFSSDPKYKYAKVQLDTGGICYIDQHYLQLKCMKQ